MPQRFLSNQKVGENSPINASFIRKVRNFINNFDVVGGVFQFDGYRARLVIDQQTATASSKHPFKVTKKTVSGTTYLNVSPGTINSLLPSNIFNDFSFTGSGTEYVIVTLTTSASNPQSAAISVTTSAPTPSSTTEDAPPTTCIDVIAVLVDGKIYQIRNTNLVATSVNAFDQYAWNAGNGAYETNPWYRWEIKEADGTWP